MKQAGGKPAIASGRKGGGGGGFGGGRWNVNLNRFPSRLSAASFRLDQSYRLDYLEPPPQDGHRP